MSFRQHSLLLEDKKWSGIDYYMTVGTQKVALKTVLEKTDLGVSSGQTSN